METIQKKKSLLNKMIIAQKGALIPYLTEISIRIQSVLILIGSLMGYYFNLSRTEWIMFTIASSVLIITESLNTAIEKLVDLVSPNYNAQAGKVKDIAAGSVYFAAVALFIVSIIIFLPHFNIV